ncbi:MAG: DJ-1/PfpI family protein [Pseudomonadota bacterium]
MAEPLLIEVFITPHFNLAATSLFIDPFRVANYLSGIQHFKWRYISTGPSEVISSSGLPVHIAKKGTKNSPADILVISSSWTPEEYKATELNVALSNFARTGKQIVALDTGSLILANAGLLDGKRATVHYEHIDAFIEQFPNVDVTEDLFTLDGNIATCCGGVAVVDLALHILRDKIGEGIANKVARYIFHHAVRGPDSQQNPKASEPLGKTVPTQLRAAIDLMEQNLEDRLTISEICKNLQISQRHLTRLFQTFVKRSPVQYYSDIRLDRARGLVTQT